MPKPYNNPKYVIHLCQAVRAAALATVCDEASFCARHRDCIYFFCSEENRAAFLALPDKYSSAPPPPTYVPARAAVLAPKSQVYRYR